ncbi:hydrophobe/amphiphile efflux-1 family RND transporter [Stenotrophomonas sp. ZAC14D1_NAIMI4_6]|uniref:efflux RND transporter permease subunit n=1 Tax=unclassified Stenotrophomonas maltophilia group TaxID=2961925 RepID=UPI000D53E800|nr:MULTISPECIES: efflux RND transporter permease subunit [unclassified Stenotrophomonas maltophilia group]AWH38592.1 hydrophobe/amphiphile efflux-1 family RND transporter [Stenotrophomonas sp. ZAC14D1_NAIMI4_6]AWH42723.1 hydrophobe/amphiphile efflux-1 family RND transporter [Stenotrophomonas sp. ZAC14D1_NAIMI4_1]
MARFFIDRPIFAWVIALLIMLVGGLALVRMPVAMYPDVAPPTITITGIYPGASASVIEETVVQVVEQQLAGLDGMLHFSSQSYSYGGYAMINVVFRNGIDLDQAQTQVQGRVQLAMPSLPEALQRRGLAVTKSNGGYLQMLAFVSEDGRMNEADVSDYVGSTVADAIRRVPGVGQVREFGGKYAMRIWLDPVKMDRYQLSVDELVSAIGAENLQVPLGEIGGAPAVQEQQLSAFIEGASPKRTAAEFAQVVIRSQEHGGVLRLGDVARIELGAESYDFGNRLNGKPAAGIGISLAPGANALETRAAIDKAVEALGPGMPAGVKAVVPYDTTPFVRLSINGVVKTLLEAIVLVFVVMYLFLQNLRATLIPTIAVPVVLLGTFGILAFLGFSVNMLTMFAMVLAIGLLVDDAIVVVENVERIMAEEGLSARDATRKSMDQITGALVGIGVVLSAVFVPMAFMQGATGVIYRQFTATLVSAMALSVIVAIILTPALCATLLKPAAHGVGHAPQAGVLGRLFSAFNRRFDRASSVYQRGVGGVLARPRRFLLAFLALGAVMTVLFVRLPSSFLPNEDQGTLVVLVQTPVGSTLSRTQDALAFVENYFLQEDPVVESMFTVAGYNYSGMGQNSGLAFLRLKDWSERPAADSADAIVARASKALARHGDASMYVLSPPPVPGLGTVSGFSFFLKDDAGHGHAALAAARDQLLAAAAENPALARMRANGMADAPTLKIDVDTARARSHGLDPANALGTLSAAWGGRYVADFVDRGRTKRVYVQADAPFRMKKDDLNLWSVKNAQGSMVPFASFARADWSHASPRLERQSGVSAMEIQGEPAPGVASGEAMAEIERLAAELPAGFSLEWTGAAVQEQGSRSQALLLFVLSIVVVFLCLAALYESWAVPTAVLLVAPLGILGAVLANTVAGLERDIYFQVAMLTTVGLTSKNAILIVAFAREHLQNGAELIDATLHAVRDRLRPIIMTSLAFGLGVLPLVLASGAGSGAQRAIGTGVLGGMVVGTLLGLVFVPLFFVIVMRTFGRR